MYPKNFASSVDNLVDLDEGPTVTRQPATLPKSHNSDFSRHHHMCGASPARALGLVPKSHTVSMGSLILSEECSRHNEYRTSHTELSDVESLRSSLSCSNNRNVKCDTLLKPPILPRKTKKNKPPVPPRKFGPSVNYSDFSEHDTIAASTQSSATARISQDVASPINDGHQKQTKTHERVVLRYVCVYVCVCVCACVCVCVYVCVRMCVYLCVYIFVYGVYMCMLCNVTVSIFVIL